MEKKKTLYVLTNEHRAQLGPWADKWIANALSCDPYTDLDRGRAVDAVCGLYEAAGLSRPKHIVFVPSPLVLALAGPFAAAIWHVSRAATDAATGTATWAATGAATDAATDAATRAATWAATRAATRAATDAATRAATGAATWAATRAATWAATRAATDAATDAAGSLARLMLRCCSSYYNMWDGGNQWSGWSSYLSFFRHVAGLPLDYSRWQHYETLAEFGPRILHQDFCMISERPEFILRDDLNRPHCETGPFTRWRDGWSLWYIHGVAVTEQIVMRPETLTVEQIRGEPNAEVRRVMLERFGYDRWIKEAGAQKVQADDWGTLWRIPRLSDQDPEDGVVIEVVNTTPEPDGHSKHYFLAVPPTTKTAFEAWKWLGDLRGNERILRQGDVYLIDRRYKGDSLVIVDQS